jgi:hypothetical protein
VGSGISSEYFLVFDLILKLFYFSSIISSSCFFYGGNEPSIIYTNWFETFSIREVNLSTKFKGFYSILNSVFV